MIYIDGEYTSTTMSYDLTARNNALDSICEISLNGYTTKKLDFLGTIHIYGVHYFNVFRRYNSVYEIVIEDFHGDFHFHKDYTIRQSLQHILCLSDEQMEGIYTRYATSFKHGSCPLTSMHDAPNMHWSELQHQWQAAALDFGGILEEYHRTTAQVKNEVVNPILEGPLEDVKQESQDPHTPLEVVGTPCVLHAPLKIPYAPLQERTKPQQININLDSEAAEILLSLRSSRARGMSLSDRFKKVENKKRTWTQLSESESESDSEDDEQDQEDDEQEEQDNEQDNEQDDEQDQEDEEDDQEEEQEEPKRKPSWCTVLRNGTTILRY